MPVALPRYGVENCSILRSGPMAEKEFRRMAERCLRLADQTTDPVAARTLLGRRVWSQGENYR